MAHKTGKEESVSVPENTITLCVTCGVATNYTSNNNSCQKCTNMNKVYVEKPSVKNIYLLEERPVSVVVTEKSPEVVSTKKVVNRCNGCRKKVGLTGFTCRCGDMFCSEHRYSDRHDCSYDYKGAGREMIKRQNPVVKADKLVKI